MCDFKNGTDPIRCGNVLLTMVDRLKLLTPAEKLLIREGQRFILKEKTRDDWLNDIREINDCSTQIGKLLGLIKKGQSKDKDISALEKRLKEGVDVLRDNHNVYLEEIQNTDAGFSEQYGNQVRFQEPTQVYSGGFRKNRRTKNRRTKNKRSKHRRGTRRG